MGFSKSPHPRVLVVAGTRPECLKTASLVRALKRYPSIDVCLINSGQHRALVEQTFAHLGLEVDVALPSPAHGRSLSHTVAALRQSLTALLYRTPADGRGGSGRHVVGVCGRARRARFADSCSRT